MIFTIILNDHIGTDDWVRNLGSSLFVTLLYYKGLTFFTLDKEYQIIEKRKRKIKTAAKYLTIRDGIKEMEQMYKETYKNLIINNFAEYELEEIMDFIFNYITNHRADTELIKKVGELYKHNTI